MYEPRRVLEKYQQKLSELLGVDISKVKSFGQHDEVKPKKEKELTKI